MVRSSYVAYPRRDIPSSLLFSCSSQLVPLFCPEFKVAGLPSSSPLKSPSRRQISIHNAPSTLQQRQPIINNMENDPPDTTPPRPTQQRLTSVTRRRKPRAWAPVRPRKAQQRRQPAARPISQQQPPIPNQQPSMPNNQPSISQQHPHSAPARRTASRHHSPVRPRTTKIPGARGASRGREAGIPDVVGCVLQACLPAGLVEAGEGGGI